MKYDAVYTFTDAVKETDEYKAFADAVRKVQADAELRELIQTYERLNGELSTMEQYSAYVSTKALEDQIKALRKDIMSRPLALSWQQANRDLARLLDELTDIVFAGVSDDLETGRMGKIHARHRGTL